MKMQPKNYEEFTHIEQSIEAAKMKRIEAAASKRRLEKFLQNIQGEQKSPRLNTTIIKLILSENR